LRLIREVFALLRAQGVWLPRASSLSLSLLSRVLALCRRCRHCACAHSGNCLPCGSFPLRRFPGGGQLLTSQRLPASGLRCLLSVSHALKAFFRPPPAGLISCRSRPWGLPFRVFRHPRSD